MIIFHHWVAGCPGETIHRISGFGIHLPPPGRRIGGIEESHDQAEKRKCGNRVSGPPVFGGFVRKILHARLPSLTISVRRLAKATGRAGAHAEPKSDGSRIFENPESNLSRRRGSKCLK